VLFSLALLEPRFTMTIAPPRSPAAALKKLSRGDFGSSGERDELLAELVTAEGLKPKDLVWMLFRPDRAIRDKGMELISQHGDLEVVDLFLAQCQTAPPAVLRAVSDILFRLGVRGLEQRLAQIATSRSEANRDMARKILAEAPVSKTLEPILWQLAGSGDAKERWPYLESLAEYELDAQSTARWLGIAEESDQSLSVAALVVLATKAPESAIDLFVERLPKVDYDTQQHLIGALTATAAHQGAEFADRILPLLASADARTRSAVLNILVSMPDRAGVVRRSLVFSKTLVGWARDRALESMKAFGEDLVEPTIELLEDDDEEVRALAMTVACSFEDPRIVPAMIPLLQDDDWWIRITTADSLGRLGDRRAVAPLVEALGDPEVRWAAVEALGRLGDSTALKPLAELLRAPDADVRVEVLLALRRFDHPGVLGVVEQVARKDPHRAVRSRALEIARELAARQSSDGEADGKLEAEALKVTVGSGEPKLHGLLVETRNKGASDLHLSIAEPPLWRLGADLVRTEGEILSADDTEKMFREILSDEQGAQLAERKYLDFCYHVPNAGRYRGNIFLDRLGLQAVFRVIPEKPPTITEVGLPSQLGDIADYKSTTQAALVNLLNESRHGHILTLEDPVEFVHPFKNCLVNQREVGSHSESFSRALRAALREDPDIIVIGDLRDPETTSMALTAAETGHLVLATLNATSSMKAIDRIVASFPADEQPQTRVALSESLTFVIAQRLLPATGDSGRVAGFEILRGTRSIAHLIREDQTFQIPSALQIGRSSGMQSFDDALRDLVKRGRIEPQTAFMAAEKKEDFEAMVPATFLEQATFF
jgi:twitching motility protein PilT